MKILCGKPSKNSGIVPFLCISNTFFVRETQHQKSKKRLEFQRAHIVRQSERLLRRISEGGWIQGNDCSVIANGIPATIALRHFETDAMPAAPRRPAIVRYLFDPHFQGCRHPPLPTDSAQNARPKAARHTQGIQKGRPKPPLRHIAWHIAARETAAQSRVYSRSSPSPRISSPSSSKSSASSASSAAVERR